MDRFCCDVTKTSYTLNQKLILLLSLHFSLITVHPAHLCKEATNISIREKRSIKQSLEDTTYSDTMSSALLIKWKLPQKSWGNRFTYCHAIV